MCLYAVGEGKYNKELIESSDQINSASQSMQRGGNKITSVKTVSSIGKLGCLKDRLYNENIHNKIKAIRGKV